MSRTYHHGYRARERKFGKSYQTFSSGSRMHIVCYGVPNNERLMKWPKAPDLITASILGDTLIATPPKRRKHTWHIEWMRGSRGPRGRSRSHWMWLYFTRPERAHVRQLIRAVLHLRDLDDWPIFPAGHRPHFYYW